MPPNVDPGKKKSSFILHFSFAKKKIGNRFEQAINLQCISGKMDELNKEPSGPGLMLDNTGNSNENGEPDAVFSDEEEDVNMK